MKVLILLILIVSSSISQWQSSSNGVEGTNPSQIYVNGNELWIGDQNKLYKSTNEGNSWIAFFNNADYPYKFLQHQNYIYYIGGYFGDQIYRSSNSGLNWQDLSSNIPGDLKDFLTYSNNIFVAAYGYGIYKSNNGLSWLPVNNGLNSLNVQSLTEKNGDIYAGTRSNGIALSTNSGESWEPVNNGLNNLDIRYLTSGLLGVYAYAYFGNNNSGVYYSTNSGLNWLYRGLRNKEIRSIIEINNVLFAMVYNDGIYKSTNQGLTWDIVNDGLTNLRARYLTILNNYLYLCTGPNNSGTDKAVWKRLGSQVIGFGLISNEIPRYFQMRQNYPNPFNPSTKITFDIPHNTEVKITVYDILGKEVEVLVNKNLNSGRYSIDWTPTNLNSGVYFCKINSNNFSQTIKMLYVR